MSFMKILVLLLLLLPALALADQDADYLAAREAYRVGNAAKLDKISAQLEQSPLEPYLAYYQLRMRLESADDSTVLAFLSRADDTPLIDRMRAEWLRVLGKNRRWITYAEQYPLLLNSDTGLACYALQARQYLQNVWIPQHSNDAVIEPPLTPLQEQQETRNLWMAWENELPEGCVSLFDAALAKSMISEADVRQRMRLALESGDVALAKKLIKKLPAERAILTSSLSSAAANPERYLSKAKLNTASAAQRSVALFALQRLAKKQPQLAYTRWEKISEYFSADERHYFFGWLGYEAARKQDARALDWYKAAGGAPLTEAQLAWRARAALRAQSWHEVRAAIASMAAPQQSEGVWRYWKGRALRELGRLPEAEALFVELSAEHNYYGQLAAEELGASSASGMISANYQADEKNINDMLAIPAVQRTLALYRMDLRTDAALEWGWATRKFDDKQLLVAAEIARRNEMYEHTINTADRTVQLHDFNLRYPAPYRQEMQDYVRTNDLEEAWVFGLMRQESRFVAQAKSTVGAAGVMQIMPATARWIAKKLGMKNYRKAFIHQLDTNLKLGTHYMKTVLSALDNNLLLASAAYNAGPRRAREWRAENALEGAIYVETIPFDETRQYVKKVMSNAVYYAKLFGQPPRSLKDRLGIIAGSQNKPANIVVSQLVIHPVLGHAIEP